MLTFTDIRFGRLKTRTALKGLSKTNGFINPLKPEFTIVIFIHYKAVVDEMLFLKQFHENFLSKTTKLSHSSEMRNDALMHREDLKG